MQQELQKKGEKISIAYESFVATEYDAKVLLSLQGGTAADIFLTRRLPNITRTQPLIDGKYIVPLDGLASGLRGTDAFKAIFFIPNTLSVVIVGFLWGLLLNPQWGIINQTLKAIGLGAPAKPWLGDMTLAFPTIISVNSWRGMGFYVLVFLAGILGISREVPEAGRIDGASELQIAARLVLPQILPLVGTLTMLKVIWSFNVFDIIFAMEGVQAGPAGSSDVLGTLFYRIAFGGLGASQIGMGLGATVVTLTFLVVFPVSIVYVYIVDRRAGGGR